MIKKISLILLITSICAFYDSNSKVIHLTKDNFNELVTNSDDLWIVEFYAHWCGHCKSLVPEYDKAAKALNGMVKFGAVDMDKEQSVGAPFEIKGFPTLKIFGANKKKPTDYNSERTTKAIVDQLISEIRKLASERINAKGSSTGSQKSQGSANHDHHDHAGHSHSSGDDHAGSSDVVELTGDNFKELVMQDGIGWLVMFFAPWCGHCKSAIPELNEAAAAMKKEKRIRFARINCDEHKATCADFQVRGYPTIKWFANSKDEDYQMQRDKASFISFVEGKKEFISPPKALQEMLNQEIFNEACIENDGGLCVIAFLPSLVDSGVEKRAEYIAELENIKNKHKGKPLSFLWSEGGSNFDFEDSFGLGFGFPALLAIHNGKKKYAVMRSHYNLSGIDKFIGDLMVGRVSIQSFYQIPNIKTKKPKVTSEEL